MRKWLVILVGILGMVGCVPWKQSQMSPATIEIVEEKSYAMPTTCPANGILKPILMKETKRVKSAGPSFSNLPEKFKVNEASPPKVDWQENRLRTSSNGVSWSGESLTESAGKGPLFLYVLGGLAILGGIAVGWFFKQIKLAAVIVGAGLVLIACAVVAVQYPWVLGLALIVCVVCAIVLLFGAGWAAKIYRSLVSVMTGVETANPIAAGVVKRNIELVAGRQRDELKAVVGGIKAKEKIAPLTVGDSP